MNFRERRNERLARGVRGRESRWQLKSNTVDEWNALAKECCFVGKDPFSGLVIAMEKFPVLGQTKNNCFSV